MRTTTRSLIKNNGRFLFFGVLVAMLSSFGQTYFIGIYRPFIKDEFFLTDSDFGLLYLLITLGSAVGLNQLGHLIDRAPLVKYAMVLVAMLGLAVFSVALTGGIVSVLLTLLLVRLLGQGMMVHMCMTSMSRYFEAGRGRAVAIASLGMPFGQAVFPPLAVLLLMGMSWRSTWMVFAGVTLGIGVPLVLFSLKGFGKRHYDWLQIQSALAADAKETSSKRRRDVIRDWRFYIMLPTLIVSPFWVTAVFFFASEIAASKGLSMPAYTGFYWVFSLGAACVPFLGGALVDRFGGLRLLPVYPPVLAAGLLFGAYSDSLPGLAAYMILLGISAGLAIPITNAMWAELYGTRYLGEIKSLATSLLVLSTALAPYVLGVLLDGGLTVKNMLLSGVVHALLSLLLLIPLLAKSRA